MLKTSSLSPSGLEPAMERPCKLCGAAAPVVGYVNFNRHNSLNGEPVLPFSDLSVSYNRCSACKFLFSADFDSWSHDDFKQFIYNNDYALIDPEYAEIRPAANLTWIEALFGNYRANLRILDYGGGNGQLEKLCRAAGFTDMTTYDPFTPEFSKTPEGTFQVISCFETMEHVPRPLETIERLCRLAGNDGVILFSTLVQPPEIEQIGLGWWYVIPRNGHISLFSDISLQNSFNRFGYKVASLDPNKFLAFNRVPDFAKRLFSRLPDGQYYIT